MEQQKHPQNQLNLLSNRKQSEIKREPPIPPVNNSDFWFHKTFFASKIMYTGDYMSIAVVTLQT